MTRQYFTYRTKGDMTDRRILLTAKDAQAARGMLEAGIHMTTVFERYGHEEPILWATLVIEYHEAYQAKSPIDYEYNAEKNAPF